MTTNPPTDDELNAIFSEPGTTKRSQLRAIYELGTAGRIPASAPTDDELNAIELEFIGQEGTIGAYDRAMEFIGPNDADAGMKVIAEIRYSRLIAIWRAGYNAGKAAFPPTPKAPDRATVVITDEIAERAARLLFMRTKEGRDGVSWPLNGDRDRAMEEARRFLKYVLGDVPAGRVSVAPTPEDECGDSDDTDGPCRLRPNHFGAHYWEPVETTTATTELIRDFHGDDVWRDDNGQIWVRQEQLVAAVAALTGTQENGDAS